MTDNKSTDMQTNETQLSGAFVQMKDVYKIYDMGGNKIHAADGVTLSIDEGEFCVVVGPSGAGKTTVLNILGGMDTATSGTVILDGKDISRMTSMTWDSYSSSTTSCRTLRRSKM